MRVRNETEHPSELFELDASEWLGEYVSNIGSTRDVKNTKFFILNLLSDPVEAAVYVLHCALMFGVLGNLKSRIIINE
jgi:hypothetical protein